MKSDEGAKQKKKRGAGRFADFFLKKKHGVGDSSKAAPPLSPDPKAGFADTSKA